MMTPDEMIAVIQAYKDGKKIEFCSKQNLHDTWGEASKPCFNFDSCDYRIAPEDKYVYLNFYEDKSGAPFVCSAEYDATSARMTAGNNRTACIKVKYVKGQYDE